MFNTQVLTTLPFMHWTNIKCIYRFREKRRKFISFTFQYLFICLFWFVILCVHCAVCSVQRYFLLRLLYRCCFCLIFVIQSQWNDCISQSNQFQWYDFCAFCASTNHWWNICRLLRGSQKMFESTVNMHWINIIIIIIINTRRENGIIIILSCIALAYLPAGLSACIWYLFFFEIVFFFDKKRNKFFFVSLLVIYKQQTGLPSFRFSSPYFVAHIGQ